jgi:hypothetical protein
MPVAKARAMPSEAPLFMSLANDAPATPATTIAARPTPVRRTALPERIARTKAIADPASKTATTACALRVAEPKTVEKNGFFRQRDKEVDADAKPELDDEKNGCSHAATSQSGEVAPGEALLGAGF